MMFRRSTALFLRHSLSSFKPINNLDYPFVYHLSTPPITIPDSVNSFGFCRRFCNNAVSDHVCSELVPRNDVDILLEIITENSEFDNNNLEEALDKAEIRLSTELVVGILDKLCFTETLAFRFFMWAARKEDYRHDFKVYNDMIEILSSSKERLKQYRIICHVLDYMKRNEKKSIPVEVLLSILSAYCDKYLTEVLKCSSKKKKKRFRIKKPPMSIAFNLLIDGLCKCGLVHDADLLFRRMRGRVSPDVNTFTILFFGWCRVRNPKRGVEVLEEMCSLGFAPDSFTYNTAIDSFCKGGMVNKAVELYEFMKLGTCALCPPTAKTYAIMILGFVKSDRIEEGFKAVDDMMKSGCLPDVHTYKKLIEEMCLVGKVEEAYKFMEEMSKKGYPSDIVTYNCFLKVLCENKKADEARDLYAKMVEMRCIPSVHSFNMLLEMFFAMGDLDGVNHTWDQMDEKRCNRDANTYCIMIEGFFDNNKVEDACLLLEDIVNRDVKLPYQKYEVFLTHLSKIGDLRGIQCLSDHMKKFYNHAMARRFSLSQKRMSVSLRG